MGCAGDPRCDNRHFCDYHGIGWLSRNHALWQLMIAHSFLIAVTAKAVIAAVEGIY